MDKVKSIKNLVQGFFRTRNWPLRFRLTLYNIFALSIFLFVLLIALIFFLQDLFQQIQEDKIKLLNKNTEVIASIALKENSYSSLQEVVLKLARNDRDVQLIVIGNEKGIVLASSDIVRVPIFKTISESYLLSIIAEGKEFSKWQGSQYQSVRILRSWSSFSGDFSQGDKQNLNMVANRTGTPIGFIYFKMTNTNWQKLRDVVLLRFFLLFFILSSLAIVGSFLSASRLSQPIVALAWQLRQIARGRWSKAIEIDRHDEIGMLKLDMEIMRRKIQRAFSRIELQKNQIQEYSQSLELKVEERTERLSEALNILQQRDASLQNELNLAAEIQRRIFPPDYVTWDGLECAAIVLPMAKVSGDFFEIIKKREFLNVILTDVSGHGVPAALVTMAVKQIYQTQTVMRRTPVSFYQYLNEEIFRRITTTDYLTAFNLFFTSSSDFIYSSAGHRPAMLWRSFQKKVIYLQTDGVLIGAFADAGPFYDEKKDKLNPGDRILIYTDGIIEQENTHGEDYGEERLRDIFIRTIDLPVNQALHEILNDFHRFRDSMPVQDDISMIILSLSPNYEQAIELVETGKKYLEDKNYAQAEVIGRRIYELVPFLPDGLYLIGVSLFNQKRYSEAVPFLQQYLKKFLDSVTSVGYMYFRSLMETGQKEEALTYAKRIVHEDMPVAFYEELYQETQKLIKELKIDHN